MATLKPAYLLHGDDHGKLAERRAKLRDLATRLGADIEFLEGDRSTPDAAADALGALTLGAEQRVIIVDDVQRWKDKDVAARLAPAIGSLDGTTTIAFFAREEKSRAAPPSLVKAVGSAGGVVDAVKLPDDKNLGGWVVREASAAGIELDREAGDLIGRRIGRRPTRLARVIEILALGTDGGRLGAADVAPFVGDDADLVAWPLVDALVAGDEAAALRLMLELGARGESSVRLLMMVGSRAREVRDLAVRLGAGEARKDIEASMKGPTWMRGRRVAEAERADRAWLDTLVARLSAIEIDSRGMSAGDPDVLVVQRLFRPQAAVA